MATRYGGTACRTCRRQGRKCDKVVPACGSCVKKRIECEGYVLRWAGLASRGKNAGRQIPVMENTAIHQKKQSKGTRRKLQRNRSAQNEIFDASRPLEQPETPLLCESRDENPSTNTFSMDEDVPGANTDYYMWNRMGIDRASVEASQTNTRSAVLEFTNFAQMPGLFEDDLDYGTTLQHNDAYIGDRADTILLPTIRTSSLLLGSGLEEEEAESSSLASVATPTRPLDFFNIPHDMRFLLSYHLLEVAPKMSVDNNAILNPYREYILPLAHQSQTLLYACGALAACHYNVRLSNEMFHYESLKYRGKAMSLLQEDLYCEERARNPATLATILMLTMTDVCLGGVAKFDTHFQGAKKLIELRGAERTPDSFVEQSLAWLDTMAAASHARRPVFSTEDIESFTYYSSQQWSHDVIPCPLDQFEIVHKIVDLYKEQEDPGHPTREILEEVSHLKQLMLTRQMHTDRGPQWLHLTEAYRHAIVLYMLRLFHSSDDEDEVEWLAHSVFYHAKQCQPSTGYADQLLWPLFHAALEIKDDRKRAWVRERARLMQLSGGFRNVESAMKILEKVWSGDRPTNYMDLMDGTDAENLLLI
ncbi:hypothetical protein BU16DRAFT_580652 [Lophium mytilinum]|uniref:Zn(2)-C6 fungal-type domain-containing protein n=1 Tax=Lophium mytilinum TaxID=390894 RepID=A0A6A6QY16_9PEZI|nr:hypothetical protein BU16DRAFT_580652 [Lophium mytilinum]